MPPSTDSPSTPPDPRRHGVDGSESTSSAALAPATVEALARYDEATPEELEALTADPRAARVLRRLRATEAYLVGEPEAVSAEDLFDYGRGELHGGRHAAVREHLDAHAMESGWVESLRQSPPPATLSWEALTEEAEEDAGEVAEEEAAAAAAGATVLGEPPQDGARLALADHLPGHFTPRGDFVATGPLAAIVDAEESADAPTSFPSWLAWTPLAAAALILAMAVGGTGRRSVLEGGLPDSPIVRSAGGEALLFPRGRVLASTDAVATYAKDPLFEVTPIQGAESYRFELRQLSDPSAFSEGQVIWESTTAVHYASSSPLSQGAYTWRATARVNGIDRDLGALSFTVVPPSAVDRALLVRAATSLRNSMPAMLREDVRRLHASGFLTDARSKAAHFRRVGSGMPTWRSPPTSDHVGRRRPRSWVGPLFGSLHGRRPGLPLPLAQPPRAPAIWSRTPPSSSAPSNVSAAATELRCRR